jgi:outer membrane protein
MKRLTAASALFLLASTAHAADGDGAVKRDRLVTIGLGAQVTPKYPGADSLQLAPLPGISLRYVGDPVNFAAADQGSSIGLLGSRSHIDFGPVVRLQGKRKQKDVGAPVDPVGFTVEAGGFVQAWLTSALRFRAEARKGFGGHKGWVGQAGIDAVFRDDDRTIFSIGPRVYASDARYQRAYFGVSPAAAVRTGLPVYKPSAGFYGVGAQSSFIHQFSPTWGMAGYVGYQRLTRDAGNSPLVRRFGSRDQFSGGLALTYTFTMHRH